LQYVVDEDGLAVPTSIKVLKGPTGFVPSAVKTILRSRFELPLSGPCHVKQLVQQSVMFKTRQEPWPPASDGRPPSPDH
jgi:3-oxoacyl-ACP reductase-like protein